MSRDPHLPYSRSGDRIIDVATGEPVEVVCTQSASFGRDVGAERDARRAAALAAGGARITRRMVTVEEWRLLNAVAREASAYAAAPDIRDLCELTDLLAELHVYREAQR